MRQLYVDKNSPDDVANFNNKFISCHNPDKLAFPILHDRVNRYQRHAFNNYCIRRKKNKKWSYNENMSARLS